MKSLKLYSISGILVVIFLILSTGKTVLGQGIRQIHLIINPKPAVNFGAELSAQNPMTFNFSDFSSVSSGAVVGWHWNFGDGNTSILTNPVHTYGASGYYNVTLTVENQSGCQDSLTKTILIESSDNMNIAVNNPVQCSLENSFVYAGTGVPVNSTYQWVFGDGAVSNLANPTHHYANSGTFNVRLIVSAEPPSTKKDTVYMTVKVIPTPSVQSINHVYCSGEEVPACYFTGDLAGTSYRWNRVLGQDIGIGLNQTSGVDSIPGFTAQNTGFQYLSSVYHVKPYYTVDGHTCAGPGENFMITVNPVPQMADIIDRVYYNGQTAEPYTFTGNTPNTNYSWRFLSGDAIEGLPAAGNNQMPAFLAVNDGISRITAVYEAVPDYAYANKTCIGTAGTFSVTVMPNSLSSLANHIQVCGSENSVWLSCRNEHPDISLYHKITFSEKAVEAGFANMNDFATFSGDSILVAIPYGVKPEKYIGYLQIKTNYSGHYEIYDFIIDVMKPALITQQPSAKAMLCSANSFIRLEVAAEGTDLNYQWYKDSMPIAGAVYSVYEKAQADSSDFGSYMVEVIGACGTVKSSVSGVEPNNILIMQKWDDVIFVSNRDSIGNKKEIEAYQWYRIYSDGGMTAIQDKGQSQYYSENDMRGTFAVEVIFSDGSKQMSCPYTLIQVKKAFVRIYPNPVKSNEKINVFIDLAGNKAEGSKIEIFDELGRLVDKKTAMENMTEFYLNVPSAAYIFKITEPNGQITTQKVIIK